MASKINSIATVVVQAERRWNVKEMWSFPKTKDDWNNRSPQKDNHSPPIRIQSTYPHHLGKKIIINLHDSTLRTQNIKLHQGTHSHQRNTKTTLEQLRNQTWKFITLATIYHHFLFPSHRGSILNHLFIDQWRNLLLETKYWEIRGGAIEWYKKGDAIHQWNSDLDKEWYEWVEDE